MEKKREPGKLNKRQTNQLLRLMRYSSRYEINIQFWPLQTSVFIAKNDVDLTSFGGDFDDAIPPALEYLKRINSQPPRV